MGEADDTGDFGVCHKAQVCCQHEEAITLALLVFIPTRGEMDDERSYIPVIR